jgi:hypothetical protein
MTADKDSLQVLADHYKDSFDRILEHRETRDRVFIFLLLVMAGMLFQLFSPAGATQAISDLAAERLGLTSPIDSSFIASMLWFALLALTVRYYQAVIVLERQYEYIHVLEDELSPSFGGKAFTREGHSYLSHYPLFSKWASILYTIAFPLLLAALVLAKIISEAQEALRMSVTLGFDFAVAVLVLVSLVLGMITLHSRVAAPVGDK